MASQSLASYKITSRIFSLVFDKAGKRSERSSNLYKPFLQGSVKGKSLTLETKWFPLRQAQRAGAAQWSSAESFLPPFGAAGWTLHKGWQWWDGLPLTLQPSTSLFSLFYFLPTAKFPSFLPSAVDPLPGGRDVTHVGIKRCQEEDFFKMLSIS